MQSRCCVFSHAQLRCLVFFSLLSPSVGTLPLDLLLVSLIKGHSYGRCSSKGTISEKAEKHVRVKQEKKNRPSPPAPPPTLSVGPKEVIKTLN